MKKSALPFFEIKDAALIAKVLNATCRHNVPIIFWIKNQKIKFETRIIKFFQYSRRFQIELPESVSDEQFIDCLREQKNNDFFASLAIDGTSFFFKTECAFLPEKHILTIALPKSIYKLQRRVNLRIPFSRQKASKLLMTDPNNTKTLLEFRILDLSAGGLAFAASLEHKHWLTKGLEIQNMRFKVRASDIFADAIVIHAAEIKSDQGLPILKVGVKFMGLKSQYDRMIVQFVLDESRKMFTLLY